MLKNSCNNAHTRRADGLPVEDGPLAHTRPAARAAGDTVKGELPPAWAGATGSLVPLETPSSGEALGCEAGFHSLIKQDDMAFDRPLDHQQQHPPMQRQQGEALTTAASSAQAELILAVQQQQQQPVQLLGTLVQQLPRDQLTALLQVCPAAARRCLLCRWR